MKFFKRLFCKHEYEVDYDRLAHLGDYKLKVWKCIKCGKEKSKIV